MTGSVGVISHLDNPSLADARALAQAAEAAGADWVGLPDAFWWRDVWVMVAEAARATERIAVGPLVTNPFLRHPFHTVAAVATLQELAGSRVRLGVAAGGSEVSGAAGVSRTGAPGRIEALVRLLRSVAAGEPLDPASGRRLEVPLAPVTVTVAGRGDGVLRAAGRVADEALLWAVPTSDLERSAGVVRAGAAQRVAGPAGVAGGGAVAGVRVVHGGAVAGGRGVHGVADSTDAAGGGGAGEDVAAHSPPVPTLVWAPLVIHGEADRARARAIAAYGLLNAAPHLRERWGVSAALVDEVRAALVGGGAGAAAHLVPDHVLDDVADPDPDPARHAETAARLGVADLAVPAHELASVPERVRWARAVLAGR